MARVYYPPSLYRTLKERVIQKAKEFQKVDKLGLISYPKRRYRKGDKVWERALKRQTDWTVAYSGYSGALQELGVGTVIRVFKRDLNRG